ncbi:hypothetical protein [Oceaniovalibus sp. ACAM 378]|uniref:hypothetical protein n=1 Tax=Oceaniovalibus sp. ACAM 378 TaxID=2599923 RepID=UPI0011D6CEFA|nr:hypothetical protein [Oceaniovalibus sp. ACAM 378]TYB91272.1 hypothetical protein FQ320_01905 [Oceaniovalibus sp. ACAM 378]
MTQYRQPAEGLIALERRWADDLACLGFADGTAHDADWPGLRAYDQPELSGDEWLVTPLPAAPAQKEPAP